MVTEEEIGRTKVLIARALSRHFVPTHIRLRKQAHVEMRMYSAFVLSIEGRWLLITAGHCIDDIVDALKDGWTIEWCRLEDSIGPAARYKTTSVPFAFESMPLIRFVDETWDIAAIMLPNHVVRLLLANNVIAIDETGWRHEAQGPNLRYFLMGMPDDLNERGPEYIQRAAVVMLDIDPVSYRPDGCAETTAEMFYGRIRPNPAFGIVGMSGGPIFKFDAEQLGRYWLHAVQARRIGREISGVVVPSVVPYWRERIQEVVAQQNDGKSS
jgi:hypothetical protein